MSLGENFCLFLADIRMYKDIVNEMKAFMLISSVHLTKYDHLQLNMCLNMYLFFQSSLSSIFRFKFIQPRTRYGGRIQKC